MMSARGDEPVFSLAALDSVAVVADLARAVASLRVTGEHLIPTEVSASLGCTPTESWAMGDTLTSRGWTRTARFGLWSLEGDETEPADLDAQVTAILSRVTADNKVWVRLCASYNVDLFCGWFMEHGNEGMSIKPETMITLGTRGIVLDIDLYGGDNDKAPE